jgi:hypothetical protein
MAKKSTREDAVYAAMMLGAAKSRLELAMHDIMKQSGRWRYRARKQVESVASDLCDISALIPTLKKSRPSAPEGTK